MSDQVYHRFSARLFAQRGSAMKPGLERIEWALARAGRPDRAFRVIMVAGTNGKGTVSALTASLLTRAGLRVGLYTSPHLVDVRERFRVDGVPVPRQEVLEVGLAALATFTRVALEPEERERGLANARAWGWGEALSEGDDPLSFFELTTLMASAIFARAGVDVAVMEIGLGGREDAVNALDPQVCAITSIDFDHMHTLGDTLEEIAAHKAGIMRPDRPALSAPQRPEVERTLRAHAEAVGAALVEAAPWASEALPSWLQGRFAHNVGVAVATVKAAAEAGFVPPEAVAPEAVAAALAGFRWPGRRDALTLAGGPLHGRWFLDVGHNPAGIKTLVEHLSSRPEAVPPVGVVGLMADKDVSAICRLLATLPCGWITTCADTPRALGARALAGELLGAGATLLGSCDHVSDALLMARGQTVEPVLVCGSVYLLGDVLAVMQVDDAFFTCT